ncbi:MAG: GNAT family N-acetyltransferase [Cyanobacteria bacterium P01_F01_bin.42]
MPKIIEFQTKRLRLRQWRRSDRDPFFQLSSDPVVMEYFPDPLDREASDAMAERCERLIAERGWGLWAVEIPGEADFIGFVGLHIPSADLPFKPCVEIGWRLAKQFWGNGYATEAANGALEVAFQTLGLEEIVSFTSLLNQRSQAVMERLGMSRTTDTFMHPAVPLESPLREHCLYRLSKERWLKQK